MTRAISTLRRLRTVELKRLSDLAELASSFYHDSSSIIDPRDLQRKLDTAQAHFEKISQYDDDILDHPDLDADEVDHETANYDEHRALGLQCLADLRACLAAHAPGSTGTSSTPQDRTQQSSAANTPLEHSTCIVSSSDRLDVAPEPFDGNRLHYRSFMAQFKNWIERRATLTPLDKLIVLRKHLRGEAKTLIDSLQINESNYEVAVTLLHQAFGQVNIERQQIMASLSNLPRVKSPSDVTGLRHLLNVVQACMQRMDALGAPLTEYALALEPVLHSSIPSTLVFEYSEAAGKMSLSPGERASSTPSNISTSSSLSLQAANNISGLVDYLRRYASHREQAALVLAHHPPINDREPSQSLTPSASFGKRATPEPQTAPSTVAGMAPTPPRTRSCLFCKGPNHRPSQCSPNLNYEDRLAILDKLKRCHRCFRFRHNEKGKCKGPQESCAKCNQRNHYSSMHPPDSRSNVSVVSAAEVAEGTATATLLHTASAFVINGPQRIPVRLFLDNGSSLTFVSPKLMGLLPESEPVSTARLQVSTFSGKQNLFVKQFRITLQSTHDDEQVDINAYEYDFKVNPAIQCSARDRRVIEEFRSTHRLADTALARNITGPPVDLLIGRDQFFRIARVGVEKTLEGELVARGSLLGWIIGGATEDTEASRPQLLRANVHCCAASVSRSARELERLWLLEAIEINSDEVSPLTADQLTAVRQVKETLRHNCDIIQSACLEDPVSKTRTLAAMGPCGRTP